MSPMRSKEPKAPRCMLRPVGRTRIFWDLTCFVVLILELWLRPFEIVFLRAGSAVDEPLQAVGLASTILFSVDILLNFTTGYVHKDQVVMQRRAAFVFYLRRWFWLDLVATFPFELFFSQQSGLLSLMRFTKGAKAIKTLRYLKLLRTIRMLKQMSVRRKSTNVIIEQVDWCMQQAQQGMQVIGLLATLAHVNGCLYGLLLHFEDTDDFYLAIQRYYECFCWSYAALVSGIRTTSSGPGLQTFDVFVTMQRIFLAGALGLKFGQQLLQRSEDVRFQALTHSTLKYLRKHQISTDTQIQVLYGLQETHDATLMHNHYLELTTSMLPRELQQSICEELWSLKLLSLELITRLSTRSEEFLPSLARMVVETVFASRSQIFAENDHCTAAYRVTKGRVSFVGQELFAIEDIVDDQWLGEKALVNYKLHRSAAAVTKELTTMLVIPAQEFHALIVSKGLLRHFKEICEYMIPWGMCGRCGILGSHFSDDCPTLKKGRPKKMNTNAIEHSLSLNAVEFDLQGFLRAQGLEALAPQFCERGIRTVVELKEAQLHRCPSFADSLTSRQVDKLSPQAIASFQANVRKFQQEVTADGATHLLFLSHCKLDAGTEACLMRAELQQLLAENRSLPGAMYETPCFLDSDDLHDLNQLQSQVRDCAYVVLLLTTNVLTRPWCIVEIWTAMEAGIPILPVEVAKPGNHFVFPTEEFYAALLRGDLLDEAGRQVLADCGVELERAVQAIRGIFSTIAVTYSPHKSKPIRNAELTALLKRCGARR